MSMLRLVIANSAMAGKRIRVHDGMTIGTDAKCKIKVKHTSLCPIHAIFSVRDENGLVKTSIEVGEQEAHIYVNSRDVMHSELRDGDKLKVGPLHFDVVDENSISRSSTLDNLLAHLDEESEEVDNTCYDFAKEDLFYLTSKNQSLRRHVRFKIPSRERFIDQAQQFISRLAHKSGMDEMKIEAFMTCTKELVLNAHRHGHKFDENKDIEILYQDFGDSLGLTITDEGPGFDHRKVIGDATGVDAAQAARDRYKAGGFGGLGFQMITRMADKLEYNDSGNQVHFVIGKSFE